MAVVKKTLFVEKFAILFNLGELLDSIVHRLLMMNFYVIGMKITESMVRLVKVSLNAKMENGSVCLRKKLIHISGRRARMVK